MIETVLNFLFNEKRPFLVISLAIGALIAWAFYGVSIYFDFYEDLVSHANAIVLIALWFFSVLAMAFLERNELNKGDISGRAFLFGSLLAVGLGALLLWITARFDVRGLISGVTLWLGASAAVAGILMDAKRRERNLEALRERMSEKLEREMADPVFQAKQQRRWEEMERRQAELDAGLEPQPPSSDPDQRDAWRASAKPKDNH